jgi:hypothetical protein
MAAANDELQAALLARELELAEALDATRALSEERDALEEQVGSLADRESRIVAVHAHEIDGMRADLGHLAIDNARLEQKVEDARGDALAALDAAGERGEEVQQLQEAQQLLQSDAAGFVQRETVLRRKSVAADTLGDEVAGLRATVAALREQVFAAQHANVELQHQLLDSEDAEQQMWALQRIADLEAALDDADLPAPPEDGFAMLRRGDASDDDEEERTSPKPTCVPTLNFTAPDRPQETPVNYAALSANSSFTFPVDTPGASPRVQGRWSGAPNATPLMSARATPRYPYTLGGALAMATPRDVGAFVAMATPRDQRSAGATLGATPDIIAMATPRGQRATGAGQGATPDTPPKKKTMVSHAMALRNRQAGSFQKKPAAQNVKSPPPTFAVSTPRLPPNLPTGKADDDDDDEEPEVIARADDMPADAEQRRQIMVAEISPKKAAVMRDAGTSADAAKATDASTSAAELQPVVAAKHTSTTPVRTAAQDAQTEPVAASQVKEAVPTGADVVGLFVKWVTAHRRNSSVLACVVFVLAAVVASAFDATRRCASSAVAFTVQRFSQK